MKKTLVALAATILIIGGVITLSSGSSQDITKVYSAGQCGNNACWTCTSAVSLGTVNITVDTTVGHTDAVKLASGCTGVIHNLIVSTSNADGVKIASGVHDLTIDGGNIQCLDKAPTLHQDGVQVMGGTNIALNNLTINCGRENDTLIDSNIFFNQSGTSTSPPTNVVCDGCWLGPWAAHTVNLQTSESSGVRNSTVCPGKFPNLTFTVASDAHNAVNSNNLRPTSC